MTGAAHDHLRPVERRVLRWADIGVDDTEIARRFGRSERWVAQVRFLADLDRLLDRILRLYLSPRFAAELDEHVRTEFPRLRDYLHGVPAA